MNEKLKIDFFEISRIDHPDKFTGKTGGTGDNGSPRRRTGGFGTWSGSEPSDGPLSHTDDPPPPPPTFG